MALGPHELPEFDFLLPLEQFANVFELLVRSVRAISRPEQQILHVPLISPYELLDYCEEFVPVVHHEVRVEHVHYSTHPLHDPEVGGVQSLLVLGQTQVGGHSFDDLVHVEQ